MNYEFIVVGAGGTGGNYLKGLGRFIYSLPEPERNHVFVSICQTEWNRWEKGMLFWSTGYNYSGSSSVVIFDKQTDRHVR